MLDLNKRTLEVDGIIRAVQPRVLQLLTTLVEAAGVAVSREQLLESVWVGATVSPSSLERAISLARIAITPYQDAITTVRGFGYLFTGPVEVDDALASSRGARETPKQIVGRGPELNSFERAIAGARDGQGALRFVSGSPGIGKTRLVEEYRKIALDQGFAVLHSTVKRGRHERAFSVWLHLIADLRTTIDAGAWHDATQTLPDDMHRLLQDLADKEITLAEDAYLSIRRSQMMNALLDLFLRLVGEKRYVLILDDIHWADISSLHTISKLAALVGEMKLLLVLTTRREYILRTHQQSPSPLLHLYDNAPADQRNELLPLPLNDASELSRRIGGETLPKETLAQLHERSGGNPLFLSELLRVGAASQAEFSTYSLADLPRSIHDALLDRMTTLPAATRTALEFASAIGSTFEVALLAHLMRRDLSDVSLDLASAEEAEIVRLESLRDGTFRFTHDLLRESLTLGVPALTQSKRHAQIATALEEHFRLSLENRRDRIAEHWDAAVLAGHTREAIRARRTAATRSRALWDFERSVEHLERASELIALSEGTRGKPWFECQLELGQSLLDSGNFVAARDFLESLANLAANSDQPEISARAIATLAFRNIDNMGHSTESRATVAEQIRPRLKDDSPELVSLLAAMSFDQTWLSFEGADAFSIEALERSRKIDAPLARTLALASRERFIQHPARSKEAEDVANERLALAIRAQDSMEEIRARYCLLTAAIQKTDKQEADLQIELIRRIEKRTGHPGAERFIDSIDFATAFSENTPDQLDELFTQVTQTQLGWRRSEDEAAIYGFVQLALIRAAQGRLAELRPALELGISDFPNILAYGAARTMALIQADELVFAQKELERILPLDADEYQRDQSHGLTMFTVSWAATRLRDRDRCEKLVEWLRPHANHYLTVEAAAIMCSADRMLGRTLEVLGDLAGAIEAYETALEAETRMRACIPLAWSKLDLSRALALRARAKDAERSRLLEIEAKTVIPEASLASLSIQGP